MEESGVLRKCFCFLGLSYNLRRVLARARYVQMTMIVSFRPKRPCPKEEWAILRYDYLTSEFRLYVWVETLLLI